ncbi:response regulator transcription factor [Neptunomonas concharum]|uniref:Phosphate regulon transcriptional regulatory protein PhoB n=1 Tax=Neptunomonas concharum TaxID=1031538 RepID=A0A5P1RAQ6_9GAMM|nr:response regulator transcription factor [Neptunomonas concharum]QEQ96698.1 response regulator transcription factor [Neptunomonas concharum]
MHERILIVEDQEDINALIALNLEVLNYQVSCALNGTDGLQQAQDGEFDLIILDVMLPGIDGLQICKILRANNLFTPILMLTARKSEADRVVGLEVGADDYLTKPFSVLELQARVKALLRRMEFNKQQQTEEGSADDITVKQLQIHKTKRVVSLAGQPINLTAKEFDLLLYLVSFPGQVFSREQLLNAVWGYRHSGYEHTVNSHINRLRAKIEQDPANPQFVLTVWGVGYKFSE